MCLQFNLLGFGEDCFLLWDVKRFSKSPYTGKSRKLQTPVTYFAVKNVACPTFTLFYSLNYAIALLLVQQNLINSYGKSKEDNFVLVFRTLRV